MRENKVWTITTTSNSASKAQPAAVEWLRFLSSKEAAGQYGNGTVQHVSVADVDYTNADLKALSPWLEKKTMLAARFQFNNLDIRSAAEGACISVVAGTDPEPKWTGPAAGSGSSNSSGMAWSPAT